jgi:hypothetical protein
VWNIWREKWIITHFIKGEFAFIYQSMTLFVTLWRYASMYTILPNSNCAKVNIHSCLFNKGSFITPCVRDLTEVKSCMFNEISHMAFLVTSISTFNNFIPTFTKPETFTFLNNIVINCLPMKKLLYEAICYK